MMGKKPTRQQAKRLSLPVLISGGLIMLSLAGFVVWRLTFRFPKLPVPPLNTLAQRQRVQLGVHIQLSRLHDPVYPELTSSQFDEGIIDGEAHWKSTRPAPNIYDFKEADEVADFAASHHMSLQLHHLIWGERAWLPDWLKHGQFTPAQLRQFQHDYITKTVTHYKGRVKEWSVVNENVSRAKHYYNLKDWWADHIGLTETDLDNYFRWAHAADPSATLVLNDFSNEVENEVSDQQYRYIKAAKARGVPIDGLGMQFHINAADPPKAADVIKNMQRFQSIGAPVYVTEFDVNVNQLQGSQTYKRQVEAKITYDMVRACVESKACVSFAVFGVSEKNDVLKNLTHTDSHSFLFDSRFRPKPSYAAFRQAWLQP
jgi:endo-1,4-beta-xylanase